MKKFIFGLLIFTGSSVFTLSSCKKDNSASASATTLSTIQGDPSVSIFTAIESRSGDDSYINNSAAVLIPVDSAFINAGISASIAATLSPAACDSIVKYYTIAAGVHFNDTLNKEITFTSVLGPSIYSDSTTTTLYFDGAAAVSPMPTVIGSASIYKLTKFINVPVGSVSQIASADTSLSMFNEAFNKTSLAATLLGGSFTLFMPTNTAFINAGYPDIASIDAADNNTLTKILLYHEVPNNYFANDLIQQSTLTTVQDGSILVNSGSGALQLIGNSDPTSPASLLSNGMLAGNVLTYKISSVLLP